MDKLISSQAAIKAICERECGALKPCEAECESIWAVEGLPSVQPRKGKWIKTDRWDEVCDTLCECSECHSLVLVEEDYKYCPYCGADMRGEQKGGHR